MEHKKVIAVAIGLASVVILFAVVYGQFAAKKAMAPSDKVGISQNMPGGADGAARVPVADPETPADISAAIDAHLLTENAAIDAEVAAETADIEGELKSLDDLNGSYDENAY